MSDEGIKKIVQEYFEKNVGCSIFEVHDATGLHLNDIAKAFKMLEAERKLVITVDDFDKDKYIESIKQKAREEEAREIYNKFQRLRSTEATMWYRFFTDYMEEKLKGGERGSPKIEEIKRPFPKAKYRCDDCDGSLKGVITCACPVPPAPIKRRYYQTKWGAREKLKQHERVYYAPGKGYYIVFRPGKTFWEKYFG